MNKIITILAYVFVAFYLVGQVFNFVDPYLGVMAGIISVAIFYKLLKRLNR